jgi:hypothetical protein
MAKRPDKAAPPRDTISGLRGKLADEQNLTSHLMDRQRAMDNDRQRLQRQSAAVARILRTIGFADQRHRHDLTSACAEILSSNGPIWPGLDDEVPF